MKRYRPCLSALLMSGSVLLGARTAAAAPAQLPIQVGRPGMAPKDSGTATIVSHAAEGWFKAQWAAYRASFVSSDGRVIDNANGGISHSEGQGYGLLLALAADDRATFELIRRWAVDHLQLGPGGLFSWKWDPKLGSTADRNNASDGDVLIAWALAKAAKRFGRHDYEIAAGRIVNSLAAEALRSSKAGPILLPGSSGFGAADQPDGPVVNLSYWVFPAFRDFEELTPGKGWADLRRNGFSLLEASRFGPLGLPADWVAAGGSKPTPARQFPAAFGYDAIRIPLYLAWDGDVPPALLAEFTRFSPASDASVIDVFTGSSGQAMGGVGYRTIFALARCAAHGETVPPDLLTARDTLYYPETLRLLSISVIQERYSRCL